jgi:mannose-6-phosphate isomerase class I
VGQAYYLIGPDRMSYLSFSHADISGSVPIIDTGFPRVGIVLRGEGEIRYDKGRLPIKQGDELFLPYNIPGGVLSGDVSAVFCHPEGSPGLIKPKRFAYGKPSQGALP